jgi:hypothetical protein
LINVDIRDSEADWTPFEPRKAPEGAPNVVYIVLDDVGFSAMSCYGGPIETPNIIGSPPVPDGRDEPRRHPPQLAERQGLRALVRISRGGDQPVVSRPSLEVETGNPLKLWLTMSVFEPSDIRNLIAKPRGLAASSASGMFGRPVKSEKRTTTPAPRTP